MPKFLVEKNRTHLASRARMVGLDCIHLEDKSPASNMRFIPVHIARNMKLFHTECMDDVVKVL